MSPFSDRLAHLVNVERMAAKHDPERIADMLERLAHVTGWTIAIEGDGDAGRAGLADGVCNLIYDTATGGAKIVSECSVFGASQPVKQKGP